MSTDNLYKEIYMPVPAGIALPAGATTTLFNAIKSIEEPPTLEEPPYGDYGIKRLKDNIKYIEERDNNVMIAYKKVLAELEESDQQLLSASQLEKKIKVSQLEKEIEKLSVDVSIVVLSYLQKKLSSDDNTIDIESLHQIIDKTLIRVKDIIISFKENIKREKIDLRHFPFGVDVEYE
jgi:hypothetical protein